jgi:membrane protein
VVVMLWVYYSSQILLFGAELTKTFADKYGQPMRPAKHAMCRPRQSSIDENDFGTKVGPIPPSSGQPS